MFAQLQVCCFQYRVNPTVLFQCSFHLRGLELREKSLFLNVHSNITYQGIFVFGFESGNIHASYTTVLCACALSLYCFLFQNICREQVCCGRSQLSCHYNSAREHLSETIRLGEFYYTILHFF